MFAVNCVWSCMYIGMPEACCVCALQCMRMPWAKTEFNVEQYELQCVGGVMNGDVGHACAQSVGNVRREASELCMVGSDQTTSQTPDPLRPAPSHPSRVTLLPSRTRPRHSGSHSDHAENLGPSFQLYRILKTLIISLVRDVQQMAFRSV